MRFSGSSLRGEIEVGNGGGRCTRRAERYHATPHATWLGVACRRGGWPRAFRRRGKGVQTLLNLLGDAPGSMARKRMIRPLVENAILDVIRLVSRWLF